MFEEKILARNEVLNMTGLKATTLWRMEKAGKFPQRRQISSRRVGWLLSEVSEWISNLSCQSKV